MTSKAERNKADIAAQRESVRSFRRFLLCLPGGWGNVYRPTLHPSHVAVPHCLRYFMYRQLLGWDRSEPWSEALDTGNIFHKVMEYHYAGDPLQIALDKTANWAGTAIEERKVEWAERHPDDPILKTDKQEKAVALGIMLGQVWNETFPRPTTWKILAVERTFQMRLRPLGIPGALRGTIDAAVFDNKTQRTWLIDHKTTAVNAATRSKGLTFDVQGLLYRALWDGANPDRPATGIIHNIIQKPTIRQRTARQPETYDEYVTRCYDQYDMKALKDPHKPPMAQSFVAFTRPPLKHDHELQELLRLASMWHHKQPSLAGFPRAGKSMNACLTFSNSCKYMPLCSLENPDAWYGIMERLGFVKLPPETD